MITTTGQKSQPSIVGQGGLRRESVQELLRHEEGPTYGICASRGCVCWRVGSGSSKAEFKNLTKVRSQDVRYEKSREISPDCSVSSAVRAYFFFFCCLSPVRGVIFLPLPPGRKGTWPSHRQCLSEIRNHPVPAHFKMPEFEPQHSAAVFPQPDRGHRPFRHQATPEPAYVLPRTYSLRAALPRYSNPPYWWNRF